MLCPKCGNKPLSFASLLVTLNPFRVTCVNCGAPLKAAPIAYLWTGVHILIGVGLVELYRRLVVEGVIVSIAGAIMYVIAIFGLLFVTAYVIPWMFISGAYRARD